MLEMGLMPGGKECFREETRLYMSIGHRGGATTASCTMVIQLCV